MNAFCPTYCASVLCVEEIIRSSSCVDPGKIFEREFLNGEKGGKKKKKKGVKKRNVVSLLFSDPERKSACARVSGGGWGRGQASRTLQVLPYRHCIQGKDLGPC